MKAELSPRQMQVWIMLANDMNVKQIALELGISHKTVETHRARLYERLGEKNLIGLVKKAISKGLTTASGKRPAGFV